MNDIIDKGRKLFYNFEVWRTKVWGDISKDFSKNFGFIPRCMNGLQSTYKSRRLEKYSDFVSKTISTHMHLIWIDKKDHIWLKCFTCTQEYLLVKEPETSSLHGQLPVSPELDRKAEEELGFEPFCMKCRFTKFSIKITKLIVWIQCLNCHQIYKITKIDRKSKREVIIQKFPSDMRPVRYSAHVFDSNEVKKVFDTLSHDIIDLDDDSVESVLFDPARLFSTTLVETACDYCNNRGWPWWIAPPYGRELNFHSKKVILYLRDPNTSPFIVDIVEVTDNNMKDKDRRYSYGDNPKYMDISHVDLSEKTRIITFKHRHSGEKALKEAHKFCGFMNWKIINRFTLKGYVPKKAIIINRHIAVAGVSPPYTWIAADVTKLRLDKKREDDCLENLFSHESIEQARLLTRITNNRWEQYESKYLQKQCQENNWQIVNWEVTEDGIFFYDFDPSDESSRRAKYLEAVRKKEGKQFGKGPFEGLDPSTTSISVIAQKAIHFDLTPLQKYPQLMKLELNGNMLTQIDLSPLQYCSNLKELNLSHNHLETVNLEPLRTCKHLKILDLCSNDLTEIDLTPLKDCLEISKIGLYYNQLTSIKLPPFPTEASLKLLLLDNNELTDINLEPLQNCTNLERIDLGNNKLSEINLFPLQNCRGLQELDLSLDHNEISDIDLTPLENCSKPLILRLNVNNLTYIDLIPLRKCIKLKQLNLEFNQITDIDLTPLRECNELRSLDLGENNLANIDLSPLSKNRILELLGLEGNKLSKINLDLLRDCLNLRMVCLYSNQLSQIDLAPLQSLETLFLSSNQLTNIDLAPLQQCKDLKTIDLKNNQLTTIDLDPLRSCLNLESLKIVKNKLTEIDLTPLSNCSKLKEIDLGQNALKKVIWSRFGPELSGVNFSGSRLRQIDLRPLQECTGLTSLSIGFGGNKVNTDVSPLFKCKNLNHVNLGSDLIADIQLSHLQLPKGLEKIKLRINWVDISSISKEVRSDDCVADIIEPDAKLRLKEQEFLSELRLVLPSNTELDALCQKTGGHIVSLKLDRLGIEEIPESIGNLTKLRSLDIGWNKLTYLPDSIGKLKCLERLNLHSNQLERIPETIGLLKNLKDLVLSRNQLKILPRSVGDLISLERLFLDENFSMNYIPESISQLTNLRLLLLILSPIKKLPQGLNNLINLRIHFDKQFTIRHGEAYFSSGKMRTDSYSQERLKELGLKSN